MYYRRGSSRAFFFFLAPKVRFKLRLRRLEVGGIWEQPNFQSNFQFDLDSTTKSVISEKFEKAPHFDVFESSGKFVRNFRNRRTVMMQMPVATIVSTQDILGDVLSSFLAK